MKKIDENCLEVFPELLETYGAEVLEKAIGIGSYIFFEDYFNEFIENQKHNESILRRAGDYIEKLADSDDRDIQDLVEIGILEGLVNREVVGLAKYLKVHSKKLLENATLRTEIDRRVWLLDGQTKPNKSAFKKR